MTTAGRLGHVGVIGGGIVPSFAAETGFGRAKAATAGKRVPSNPSIEIGMAYVVANEVRSLSEFVKFGHEALAVELRWKKDRESMSICRHTLRVREFEPVRVMADYAKPVLAEESRHSRQQSGEIRA